MATPMPAIGVAVGVGLALPLGQVGRALLFGLTPSDPLVRPQPC